MGVSTEGVRGLAVAAGDLLLGACCAGCGRPGWGLCEPCRDELAAWRPWSARPDPTPSGFPPTVACAPYAGLASALITAYKDRQAWTLAPVLGRALADSVERQLTRREPAGRVVLVPAPSSARAIRERGLDAGLTVARAAARRLRRRGWSVDVLPVLRQRSAVRDQAGLDAGERAANLAGALRVVRPLRPGSVRLRTGETVVLVDDVVTTGATLAEAARALAEAGIEVAGAATVAATARHGKRCR